jgi:hypothetical protein
MFPVRYGLNLYILFRWNSVLGGLKFMYRSKAYIGKNTLRKGKTSRRKNYVLQPRGRAVDSSQEWTLRHLFVSCELCCEQSFSRRCQLLSSTQHSPPFMEPKGFILTGHFVANASGSQGSKWLPLLPRIREVPCSDIASKAARPDCVFLFSGPPAKLWNTSGCDHFFPHNFQLIQYITYHSELCTRHRWFSNFYGVTIEINKYFVQHTMLYVYLHGPNKRGPLFDIVVNERGHGKKRVKLTCTLLQVL